MPRVHTVKSARRARPEMDLEVGQTYHWWKFRNRGGAGTIVRSKTYPRPSQLTRSEFLGYVYSMQEEIADWGAEEELSTMVEDIVGRIQELGEEQRSRLENMPEGLQQGDTGVLLKERAEAMDVWASELEAVDVPDRADFRREEVEDEDAENAYRDDDFKEALEEALEDLQSTDPGV